MSGECHPFYATSQVGAQGYAYDNNGNRTADPSGLGFNYDAENHLLSLTSGSTTVFQNVYDGDGKRVVRLDRSGQSTHFIGEWYEYNVTMGIATAYYPFNGRPIRAGCAPEIDRVANRRIRLAHARFRLF